MRIFRTLIPVLCLVATVACGSEREVPAQDAPPDPYGALLPLPAGLSVLGTVDAEGLTGDPTYNVRFWVVRPEDGGNPDAVVAALRDHVQARGMPVREATDSFWAPFQATGPPGSGLGFVSIGRLDALVRHGVAVQLAVDDDLTAAAAGNLGCCAVLSAETYPNR